MIPLTVSLVRIAVGVAVVLAAGIVVTGFAVRQPDFGSLPFPEGPRADPAALRKHVEYLCTRTFPRNPGRPAMDAAADYIGAAFSATGARVTEQRYEAFRRPCRNVIARLGPDGASSRVVLGAHYDAAGELPGADDNASGVAGLLEAARLVAARHPRAGVELVAYSSEEPPYFGGPEMGSAVHARSLRAAGTTIAAMICLEMIGYYVPRQPYTTLPLYLIYPGSGDYVSVAGRWEDRALARFLKEAFRGAGARAVSYSGPVSIGADLSDNRNYWAEGFPAVMVTDTAFLRNPHYHTAGDLPATLDYDRMAGVVDGVASAVIALAADEGPPVAARRDPR